MAKNTIYKMRLNLDIWGEPYAPPTVVQGRPKALLPYQEMVIYRSLGRLVHDFLAKCITKLEAIQIAAPRQIGLNFGVKHFLIRRFELAIV